MTIGFALTGSFCTFAAVIPQILQLKQAGHEVIPIMSEFSYATDTRFGTAADFRAAVKQAAGRDILHTIPETEPVGPKHLFDLLVIAPCTGNTLGKIANGVNDTCVTMAAKAHLRNSKPLVLAVSTNDALSGSARNLGSLLGARNVYFVPMRQDDYLKKPTSLVARFDLIPQTVAYALRGEQLHPMLLAAETSVIK